MGWFCAAGLLAMALLPAAAASLTASLNPPSVTVGESATLTLQFQGGEPRELPGLPEIPGLRVVPGGTSRNLSIFNGQQSSTLLQQFAVTPLREGEFVIPSISAEVGGQRVASPPLKLVATKAAAGTQLAFLRLAITEDGRPAQKTNFYVGEVLTVELQVLVNDAVANAPNILQGFDQYTGSLIKAEGFSAVGTARAGHYRVQEGSGTYSVGRVATALAALKPGVLTIGSIEANLDLQLPVRGQRRGDIFDFGFFERYQTRKVVLAADPVTVNVLPVPANAPPGFSGAVGIYSLSATAGPTNVAAGDPVTVKVQIAGRGHLETVAMPDTGNWKEFKTYPPTGKVEATDPLGITGVKVFEQVVVPQSPAVQSIPALTFSFFDPAQKAYRTVSSRPIPLVVRPAGSQAAPTIAAARARDEAAPPTADIVHIKPKLGNLAQAAPSLVQRPWFLLLQLVPVAAVAGAFFWRKRFDALANNPRLRRRRQVTALVDQGLEKLSESAAENRSDDFFAGLFRLLQEQLGERLDLPASAITEAVIEERLRPRGVPEALLGDLQSLFQACNQARYAPVGSSQELQAFLPRVQSVFAALRSLEL